MDAWGSQPLSSTGVGLILPYLARWLDVPDVLTLARVCSPWRAAVLNCVPLWSHLFFQSKPFALVPADLDLRARVIGAYLSSRIAAHHTAALSLQLSEWKRLIASRAVRPHIRFSGSMGLQLRVLVVGCEPGVGASSVAAALARAAADRGPGLGLALRSHLPPHWAAALADVEATTSLIDEPTSVGDVLFGSPPPGPGVTFRAVDTNVDGLDVKLEIGDVEATADVMDPAVCADMTMAPPWAAPAARADGAPVNVVVLVTSVDSASAFDALGSTWAPLLRQGLPPSSSYLGLIAVNKIDLPQETHAPDTAHALAAAASSFAATLPDNLDPPVHMISATHGHGIQDALQSLLDLALCPTSAAKAAADAAAAARNPDAHHDPAQDQDSSFLSKCTIM